MNNSSTPALEKYDVNRLPICLEYCSDIMKSSQYFIAKSDKYVLVRKIGNRFFRIISDTNITPVELIYQKICSEGYTSEQELFQDIFDLYGNISIFSFNKGNDSTLPK